MTVIDSRATHVVEFPRAPPARNGARRIVPARPTGFRHLTGKQEFAGEIVNDAFEGQPLLVIDITF